MNAFLDGNDLRFVFTALGSSPGSLHGLFLLRGGDINFDLVLGHFVYFGLYFLGRDNLNRERDVLPLQIYKPSP